MARPPSLPRTHGVPAPVFARFRSCGVLAVTLFASAAAAAPAAHEVALGPGPGVHALTVRADAGGTVQYRTCPALPCPLEPFASTTLVSNLHAQGTVDVIVLRDKHVVHVKVPLEGGAWEAILSGKPGESAHFAGRTGLTRGQEGERTGEIVQLVEDDGGTHVIVADVREDLRICGQALTPLRPRVLDPRTLELRVATVPRLPAEQRSGATPVFATEHTGPLVAPLARLFAPVGASSAVGTPQAVADGDPTTTWAEGRAGDGHGEFVLLRSPAEVPIARLAVIPIPPSTGRPDAVRRAAPRRLFLVTNERTYAVTLPEDAAQHPGRAYDVPLPQPLRSSCVALVLDEAYATSASKPEVTLAEVFAYSDLEERGADAEAVAKALSGGGARADAAAGVLKRAGESGVRAIRSVFSGLDASGRALAVDVATSAPCEESAPLLVGALGDADAQVAHKARGKLERCGKAAAPALAVAVAGTDPRARALAAPLLGTVAPAAALAPLALTMGDGPADVRAEVRGAFARAARFAPAADLARLLSAARERPPLARLDLLRATTDRLSDVAPEANTALVALLAPGAPLAVRYLALAPLARLARTDVGLASRLAELIAHDDAWPVRARAAELAATVPSALPALLRAVDDLEPRVREAALRAAAEARAPGLAGPAIAHLAGDPWTFVRLASASALAGLPASGSLDAALGASAKGDASARVRASAFGALGAHAARAHRDLAIERLDDRDEDGEVRVAAAKALGAMCDPGALDALTRAARAAASPLVTGEDLAVGAASLRALAALHPSDLRARLGPLLSAEGRAETRRAAEAALAERGACR